MSSEMNSNGAGNQGSAHIRTDFRTRDVVNQAVAAIPSLGLQQAAEFLSAMNVPPEVAIRALAYPAKR
ncbi:hypothetical protein [Massilia soli]|uniref:Uncharacterized protein n=1 Tax=Massilia soli TaxID=2792854 RepID=A0ABS7SM23_9BURK|nr:hypothetical protein [Massilia soli]MBZ2207233.1 hypothetical protein [Massilia soli]